MNGYEVRCGSTSSPRADISFVLDFLSRQQLPQLYLRVGEYFIQVWLYQQLGDQSDAQNRILNVVMGQGSAISIDERMLVAPQSIRAAPLHVHKPEWCLPNSYLALPVQGNTVQLLPVIDNCARLHPNGRRRQHSELEE